MADIKLYTEDRNTRCTLVKQHLDKIGVDYDEINISSNSSERDILKELVQTDRMVLPYVYVGERVLYKSGEILNKTKTEIENRVKDIK